MRLIDADALIVSKYWANCTCPAQVIHKAPTIEAEVVVRCKDCEAFYPKDKNLLQHCTRTGLVVHKNDFCSGGERREKNEYDIVDR